MDRVNSKNLINFHLTGVADEAVASINAQLEQLQNSGPPGEIGRKIVELSTKEDPKSMSEFVGMVRAQNVVMSMVMKQVPAYQEAGKKMVVTELTVPTTHDGEYEVLVEVYTPHALVAGASNAAVIYAHGGGCVSGCVNDSQSFMGYLAVSCEVVVFNVDYRLAPETKCPNNVKDFYEVVKHVCRNARQLGIDPGRICIAGESGGGYICLGCAVIMAQNNESHLIKLAMPGICMVDDYPFSEPGAMTLDERTNHTVLRQLWRQLATNLDEQRDDPLLFPGKASDEILAKFPPTIIYEGEFDMFITEASRLAARLRRVGRLLEFVVFPGAGHGTVLFPGFRTGEMFDGTIRKLIREYLHE